MEMPMSFELRAILLSYALLSFALWMNVSHAQLLQPEAGKEVPPQKLSPNKQALANATLSPLSPKLHAVRITSPTKGQQISIGKDLEITGISSANSTSHCQVSIIMNGVKPYQPATGTGPGGAADYSKWIFVLTSKYTTLKPGPANRITAKYTCEGISSFYSVNVTGVTAHTS
ncbi:MAG: hypothetical protein JO297_05600 [Nitrososphaeraceae archaeon]|nr:hypothetical protein [Nitrososphaeraceae archaeon]